jgi:hypothetical protein
MTCGALYRLGVSNTPKGFRKRPKQGYCYINVMDNLEGLSSDLQGFKASGAAPRLNDCANKKTLKVGRKALKALRIILIINNQTLK